MVWALEILWWSPELILHECTQDSDVRMLISIFGNAAGYATHSVVFSPVDLGIPSSRPRWYTLLLK
eukprot:6708057-Lingulodinium_polyedra.AAC.1